MSLHKKLMSLMGGRIICGPLPSKRTVTVKDLMHKHGVAGFVNLTPDDGNSRWYMPDGKMQKNMIPVDDDDQPVDIVCFSFPLGREEPPSDVKMFQFVSKVAARMEVDPALRVYIHCATGTYASAAVGMLLWYLLTPTQDQPALDPVASIKRMGRHEMIKEKLYIQQFRRLCKKERQSLHSMLVKKRKF